MAANVTGVLSAHIEGPETGDGRLVVHRQVMGGSALEELELAGSPAILSMAGHAVEPVPVDAPLPVDVRVFIPTSITDADLVAQVRRLVPSGGGSNDLSTARVVVGGGRGVGGADSFDELIALAGRLGGTLGVSRVVTSLGWRPHHEQVGQTGSRITPDVYIPCGISGAIQHWAGCSSAKTIIAVNTDEEAPMVTKAHYAVIGDLHQIVPAINAALD
jgi:electron transfer flavoprotein alpha subunit